MIRLIFSLFLCGTALNAAEPVTLFDGKTLAGWKPSAMPEYWSVKDGVIIGKSDERKKNSTLWTEGQFQDFVLEAEFRYEGHVDSGFFLRNENEQIQIGISGSLKRDMTCSPYIAKKRGYPMEAVGVKDLLKIGDWNRIKIEVRGTKYIVTLNGKQVLDYTTEMESAKGPIGLQVHPGVLMEIHFRDLKITNL
jgi:hypothetical protein